jgi:phenylpropionate dioxygenase-like ring-hydroxylating dioxygenase large terminal subunit
MAVSRTEMITQMKRLLAMIDEKTTSLAEAPMPLPAALYTDEAYWRRELTELFHRRPIVLALSCEIPEPDTYVALDDVPGFRVFVTRDGNGRAHAFLNSCRHRGTPVARGRGAARRLSCPYHGWTYALNGELIGLPEAQHFGRTPCRELGLTELPCEERHGLVFGTLDPNVTFDIDAWLGECGAELAALDLASFHPMWTRQFPGPNWKICKDGFIENYHFGVVHAKSLPTLIGNINVTDMWGLHSRMLLPDAVIHEQRKKPESEWDPANAFATVYYLFPNTMIASCWGDWPLVTRLYPGLKPEESTCVQVLLSRHAPTDTLRADAEAQAAIYERVTQNEDYVLDFAIQRALESNRHGTLLLGRNEHALQHFHQSIARFVAPP